jgi:predicted nucleotidyltransferase
MKYGLPDQAVNQICAVLAQYPQVDRAVLYGSRAKGNHKPGSDIDLTLHGSALTPQHCATIADALDDLLLPYSMDLSVFALLKHPELEAHIQRVGVVFFEREPVE